jgi:hypothetical protein
MRAKTLASQPQYLRRIMPPDWQMAISNARAAARRRGRAPARSFPCRRLAALAHRSPALSIVSITVIVDTIDPDQTIKPIILFGGAPR